MPVASESTARCSRIPGTDDGRLISWPRLRRRRPGTGAVLGLPTTTPSADSACSRATTESTGPGPCLSNASFGPHEKTNIIFDLDQGTAAYSSVMVDTGDADMPYEMYVLRFASVEGEAPAGTGYYRYRSRDGYRWELFGEPIYDPMSGDLCFFYRYGPGEHVAYYRLGGKKQPGDHVPIYEDAPRRTVYRATSEDGDVWTRDESMILTVDERDHRDTQYQELVPHRSPADTWGW